MRFTRAFSPIRGMKFSPSRISTNNNAAFYQMVLRNRKQKDGVPFHVRNSNAQNIEKTEKKIFDKRNGFCFWSIKFFYSTLTLQLLFLVFLSMKLVDVCVVEGEVV